jgi:hypothetical protein
VLRTPLGKLACLVCGALLLAPEHEPGGPPRRQGLPSWLGHARQGRLRAALPRREPLRLA